MTALDLDAAEARAKAARFDEWRFGSSLDSREVYESGRTHILVPGDSAAAPARFAVYSHDDVTALVAEVRALKAAMRTFCHGHCSLRGPFGHSPNCPWGDLGNPIERTGA